MTLRYWWGTSSTHKNNHPLKHKYWSLLTSEGSASGKNHYSETPSILMAEVSPPSCYFLWDIPNISPKIPLPSKSVVCFGWSQLNCVSQLLLTEHLNQFKRRKYWFWCVIWDIPVCGWLAPLLYACDETEHHSDNGGRNSWPHES